MPPRVRSGPGNCPLCARRFGDLLEHVRKSHKRHVFQQTDFVNTTLVVCLCGSVAASAQGLNSHQARTGCIGAQRAMEGEDEVVIPPDHAVVEMGVPDRPANHVNSGTPEELEPLETADYDRDSNPLRFTRSELGLASEMSVAGSPERPISQEFHQPPSRLVLGERVVNGGAKTPEEMDEFDNDTSATVVASSEAKDSEDDSDPEQDLGVEQDLGMERHDFDQESDESVEEVESDQYDDCDELPEESDEDFVPSDTDGSDDDDAFAEVDAGPVEGHVPRAPSIRQPLPTPPSCPTYAEGRNLASVRRPAAPPLLPPPPAGTFFGYQQMDDAFIALARLPATYRPLPPPVATAFRNAAEKIARQFSVNPNDRAIFDFLCLPKVCLGQGFDSTHRLEKFPDIPFPEFPKFSDHGRRGTPSAQKQVELGRLGNASRILDGNGAVSRQSAEVLESLREKHPEGDENPFGNNNGPQFSNLPPTTEAIIEAFQSFRKDTAPGISGWTVPLLKIAMRSEAVNRMLTTLVTMLLAGTAPGRSFLCTSRLIALDKPDGGVRPIAIGELIYRLCTKAILRHSFRPDCLSTCQFGVGTRSGVEPVIRAVQRAMDGTFEGEEFTHVTSLDFSNAFNSLSRSDMAKAIKRHASGLWKVAKWAYNEPSNLVFGGIEAAPEIIMSSQGVRQGDPLGPLLFSIGIRSTLERLSATFKHRAVVMAYLDDVYILSNSRDTLDEVLAFFRESGGSLQLNNTKTITFSLAEVKATGLEMLGSCLGSTAARRDFLETKVTKLEQKMGRLVDLPHQHSLLLLRLCMQQELRHLQRCLVSEDLVDVWRRLDRAIWNTANRLRGAREEDNIVQEIITDTLYSLPARLGGLGLLSYETCAPLAYAAASEVADMLLEPLIGPPLAPPKLTDPADPESISRQRTRCAVAFARQQEQLLSRLTDQQIKTVLESASGLGRRWLSVVPFHQSLRLTDFEVSAALHVKTLHPGSGPVCTQCGTLTIEAGHAEVCTQRDRWNTARHEQVKRAIAAALSKIRGVTIVVEPLIDGTARRNDIRVTGNAESGIARHEYDVTVVSLSTRDSVNTRFPRNLAPRDPEERCHGLIQKFLNTVSANKTSRMPAGEVLFTPLVFSLGGMMDRRTVQEIQQWEWLLPQGAFSTLCQQLSVILLKARAKSFVL